MKIGDQSIADTVFDLMSSELPARELNLLASESIALCHGRGLLFGQEGMEEEENNTLGANGPFGASATWSRGMLLVSMLRIKASKRSKFLQSSLPEISRLLLGGDEMDDEMDDDGQGGGQGDGISKVLALITFLRALASSPDNDQESQALILLHILDSAGACGVVPAGPVEMEAAELITPPLHALWCGLACLTFGDPFDSPFDWPECISYLPPFVSSNEGRCVKMVDSVSLLRHPWRYAYRLWEKENTGRNSSSTDSVVEYGLGVVSV